MSVCKSKCLKQKGIFMLIFSEHALLKFARGSEAMRADVCVCFGRYARSILCRHVFSYLHSGTNERAVALQEAEETYTVCSCRWRMTKSVRGNSRRSRLDGARHHDDHNNDLSSSHHGVLPIIFVRNILYATYLLFEF